MICRWRGVARIEKRVAMLKSLGVKVASDVHVIAANWNGSDVWLASFRVSASRVNLDLEIVRIAEIDAVVLTPQLQPGGFDALGGVVGVVLRNRKTEMVHARFVAAEQREEIALAATEERAAVALAAAA